MADLFVSYSRRDSEFVRRLTASIEARGKAVWLDTEGIVDGEVFPQAIRVAIEQADSFLFVITPAAVQSRYCESEIEYAQELNKRIVPVLRSPVPDPQLPGEIRDRSWIPFTEGDQFQPSLERLMAALDRDVEHVKQHTRWLVKAIEWDTEERDRSFLLRGAELRSAEAWLAGVAQSLDPQPTTVQRRYLLASRNAATRRQRAGIAASLTVALVSIGLLVFALISRGQAIAAKTLATSRALAAESENQIRIDPEVAILLGMQAVRTSRTPEALFALRAAIDASPLRATLMRADQVNCQLQQGSPTIAADPVAPRLAEGLCGGPILAGRGASSGRLLVFDVVHGRVVRRARVGPGPAIVAYSPDGRLLAAAGTAGRVHLYDARNLTPLGGFGAAPGPGPRVPGRRGTPPTPSLAARFSISTAAAFSPDGSRLAVATQLARIAVWSLRRRSEVMLGPPISPTMTVPTYGVTFTADGRNVIAARADGVVIYDARSGALLRRLADINQAGALALSPDGHELAVASLVDAAGAQGVVSLWSTHSWRELRVLARFPAREVTAVAFSPDGASLAIGDADGSAGLWSLRSGQQQVAYLGSSSRVMALGFAAGGQRVIVAAADGTTQAWRAGGPELLAVPAGGPIARVGLVGDRVFAELAAGVTVAWRLPGAVPQAQVRNRVPALAGGVYAVTADGTLAVQPYGAGSTQGPTHVAVISTRTGRASYVVRAIPVYSIAAISQDDTRLVQLGGSTGAGVGPAGGGSDGEVSVLGGTRAVALHAPPGPPGGVLGCDWVDAAMSRDDGLVAGANFCGAITVWDAHTGQVKATMRNPGEVSRVALSPDGTQLAVGSWDSTVTIWNISARRPVVVLHGHTLGVDAVAYSPDGKLLASAGLDDTARVWDASDGRLLRIWTDPGPITSIAFSSAGTDLVTGDAGGTVRVWDACTACGQARQLLALGAAGVTRPLTPLERATFVNGA